jgi:hypothetical protein
MASTTPNHKTIAFFGASGGVGLAALKYSLAAGHVCVALCRTPAKLTGRFPAAQHPNLVVVQGNAHDEAAVAQCLIVPGTEAATPPCLVDHVVFSIGGGFNFKCMTIDDPEVCQRGMATLLAALKTCRQQQHTVGSPQVNIVSTLGISNKGRDFPLLLAPIYSYMLKVPHEDKKIMEERLIQASAEAERSGEAGIDFVIVRPSLLMDGEKPDRDIRVPVVEDMKKSGEIVERGGNAGYNISREDTGRWIFEQLIRGEKHKYLGKGVSITW